LFWLFRDDKDLRILAKPVPAGGVEAVASLGMDPSLGTKGDAGRPAPLGMSSRHKRKGVRLALINLDRTFRSAISMSALPPKAEIVET